MNRFGGRYTVDDLQESNHRGCRLRRGQITSTLWKIIHCMQFLSCNVCSYSCPGLLDTTFFAR